MGPRDGKHGCPIPRKGAMIPAVPAFTNATSAGPQGRAWWTRQVTIWRTGRRRDREST